jgi:hypothetical protein
MLPLKTELSKATQKQTGKLSTSEIPAGTFPLAKGVPAGRMALLTPVWPSTELERAQQSMKMSPASSDILGMQPIN